MVVYKKCSEVSIDLVFDAFNIGFSDYIIKLSMNKEDFIKRFFGPEGNSIELSHIALDCDKPIGVLLAGIKIWDGIKTLRCGALAIHPEYRNKGIASKLMSLHKKTAIENNCKQMFLEVIVGNDKAINFYKKIGYEKIYDLNYFFHDDLSKLIKFDNFNINIKEVDFIVFKNIISNHKDFHINWQSDLDYVEKLGNIVCLAAYDNEKLIGYLCGNKTGKINFMWINKNYRLKGIGKSLLSRFCSSIDAEKLSIVVPNNNYLEGFLKHMKFKKDPISQYEMYITI